MIPHITMVVILFLSNTLAIPRPSDKKEVNEESQVSDNAAFVMTVMGSRAGSGEELEKPEEGSGFAFRVQERSGGSAEISQEREEVSNLFWRNEEGSGEGSGEFMTLEAEMDSGMDSQVIAKIAEEEEMTTESEMIVNNLQPRFDLEMGSGDSEELFKISFEEEASGDSNNIIKIKTEGIGEGSGAEFRFAEVSNEIGSGDDSEETTVRQVDVNEEIGDVTTDVSVRQVVDEILH